MRRPRADGTALRPLGLPRPARVQADASGLPVAVALSRGGAGRHARGVPLKVEEVLEVWRIVEGWWCEAPIDRIYYRVAVDGRRAITLFREDGRGAPAGRWYEQRD